METALSSFVAHHAIKEAIVGGLSAWPARNDVVTAEQEEAAVRQKAHATGASSALQKALLSAVKNLSRLGVEVRAERTADRSWMARVPFSIVAADAAIAKTGSVVVQTSQATGRMG